MRNHAVIQAAFILLVLIAVCPVPAQQLWVMKDGAANVSFETAYAGVRIDHPNEIRGKGYKKFTSTYFIGGRYGISERFALVGDVPILATYLTDERADQHILFADDLHATRGEIQGNPFIGFEYDIPEKGLMLEFGFRIPVVRGDAAWESLFALDVAEYADLDRPGAYTKKGVPVMGAVSWRPALWDSPHRLGIRGSVGAAGRVYSHLFAGTDLMFDIVRFRLGYTLIAKYPQLDAAPDVTGQFGASVCTPIGMIRPGFAVRIPAGGVRSQRIDAAFNFYVSVVLPEGKKIGA